MDKQKLTLEQSYRVYDVLCEICNAPKLMKQSFIYHQTQGCPEYRFQGNLGFGGKFWNWRDHSYVTYYPEDHTPERERIVCIANVEIAKILGEPYPGFIAEFERGIK